MSAEIKSQFSNAFKKLQTPVFLAGLDEPRKPKLNVHIKAEAKNPYLAGQTNSIAQGLLNTAVKTKVKTHKAKDLYKPDTLSGFVSGFSHDLIVYDPVRAFERARRIVSFTENLRIRLGHRVAGVFFMPDVRSLVVVLDASKFFERKKLKLEDLREAESQTYAAIGHAFTGAVDQTPPVRIGFGLPELAVVPVDQASKLHVRGEIVKLKTQKWAAAALVTAGLAATQTAAADGKAVENANGQVSASYVNIDGESGGAAGFNFATGLSDTIGVQVDGVAGSAEDGFFGIAGQVFYRNPEQGMIGLVASHGETDDVDAQRVGVKGEIYLDQFTIAAQAGAQFSSDFDDTEYASVDFRWYMTPNFYASIGGDFAEDAEIGTYKFEYRSGFDAMPGLSFFGAGTFGSSGDDSFLIGVKNHFYGQGTLLDRDRNYLAGDEAYTVLRSISAMKDKSSYDYEPPSYEQPV